MQSSAILKQRLTTDWAVVHYRHHVPKVQRVPGILRRSQAMKARLVSTQYYYKTSVISTDRSMFKLAPTSERSKGFLVTDGTNFWIAPAVDFVCKWAEAEAPWLVEEEVARKAQEERDAKAKREQDAYTYAQRRAIERRTGAEDSIRALAGADFLESTRISIGASVSYDPERDRYAPVVDGSIQLPLRAFERIIEKYNELLDEVR